MKREHSFHIVLWVAAITFTCTRYLCAAIMCAGSLGDRGTYNMALETLGPFLPVMALMCLFGALMLSAADLVIVLRDRKSNKNK